MIRGTVQTVVYQNPENGYAVLRVNTEDGQQITVVGTVPMKERCLRASIPVQLK